MLDSEDTRGQRFRRFAWQNPEPPLSDCRAVIELFVHQVDGYPSRLRTPRNDGLVDSRTVHPRAAEFRQQPRMHVDDLASIRAYDGRWNSLHVAGENH